MAGDDENVYDFGAARKRADPISEEEVHAFCDELMASGQRPTRRLIQDLFHERQGKKPSMTTLQKFLGTWEDRQRAKAEARDVDLSPEDTEEILKFGRLLLRTVTARVRQDAAMREKMLEEQAETERRRAGEMAAEYDVFQEQAETEIAKLRGEVAALTARLETTQVDLRAALARGDGLAEQVAGLTRRAEESEARERDARDQIQAADQRAAKAEGRAEAVDAERDTARRERDAAVSNMEDTHARVVQLEATLQGVRDRLEDAQGALRQRDGRIEVIEGALTEAAGRAATLEAERKAQDEALAVARDDKAALKARIEGLERDIDRQRRDSEKLLLAANRAREVAEVKAEHAEREREKSQGETEALRVRVAELEAAVGAKGRRGGGKATPRTG